MKANLKGSSYIKGISILLIMLSVIGLLFSILGLFGIIALDFVTILLILWGFFYPIVQLLAGINGIQNYRSTSLPIIKKSLFIGYFLIGVMILDFVFGFMINGLYGFSVLTPVRFIFPVLYIVGYTMNKNQVQNGDFNENNDNE